MVNKTNFETIIIDDFNHDPINQEKVQSYPPELVGRFNSFIVTAFDDSMTVEMQLRTLIKWIKENIDVTTNALDNMEAFKQDSMAFQNHVKDTLVNLINQFTDTFDDNLQFEMQEILKQWNVDGVLSDLVRDAINEEVIDARGGESTLGERLDKTEEQLLQKASKSELNQKLGNIADGTPLFAENISEMTDTTRLYVNKNDGYIYNHDGTEFVSTGVIYTGIGLSENSVTPNETTFAEYLPFEEKIYQKIPFSDFDNPLNRGKMWNMGEIVETEYSAGLTALNVIPAYENITYEGRIRNAYFIDVNGNVIDVVVNNSSDSSGLNTIKQFTTPKNTVSLKVSVQTQVIDNYTLNRMTPIERERKFKMDNLQLPKIELEDLKDGSVSPEKTTFIEYVPDEIRNYQEIVYSEIPHNAGKMWHNGKLTENQYTSELNAVNKIIAYPNQTYRGRFRNVNFTDENDVFISEVDNNTQDSNGRNTIKEFITPPNVAYIKVSVRTIDLDSKLYRITPLPTERMFKMPNLITTQNRFESKKIVIFGDSYLDEISRPQISNVLNNRLAMDVINMAIGGAKMANRSNWTETAGGGNTAISGFRLSNAITSGDYSDQEEYVNSETVGNEHKRSKLNLIKNTNFNEIDFGIISFGVNDYLQGIPIGTIDDDTGDTFIGAYKIFLNNMLTNYPNIKWVLITPTFMTGTSSSVTNDLTDYVNAIQLVGDYFNLPVCNNYHNAGINSLNRLHFFDDPDNIHPNDFGLNHLGNRIANQLEISY